MSRLRVNLTKLTKAPHLKRLLIDGDILVYTLGFAVEERIEWPDGQVDICGDLPLAKRLLDNRIRHFTSTTPDSIKCMLVITGDATCWRKELIDVTYKQGRGRKPTDYKGLREYMASLPIFHVTTDGLEADDWLAAEASGDAGAAILSFDKDFFTVPGTFIHMSQNDSARLYTTTPVQALSFLFFQALAGDRVDAYKGVDYIGISKAAKMLQLCELKGLTVRQAYLLLKKCVKLREKQFLDLEAKKGRIRGQRLDLWSQFRTCLDLAALTWAGETPRRGIGMGRVWKLRKERMEYFLPYYDPEHTHKFTQMKL